MFWCAAAVLASQSIAQQPPRAPATPVVQATASVRILRAARLDFTNATAGETPSTTRTKVRIGEATYPARIIEFE